jgi:hypothetical protein
MPKYVICKAEGKRYEVCKQAITRDGNIYYMLLKDGKATGYFNSNGFISLEDFRDEKLKEIGI